MAYRIVLGKKWTDMGWKVKIRDKERVEPPHVTIIRGRDSWRFGLREMTFLDKVPDPNKVPDEITQIVRRRKRSISEKWNQMYPENPVGDAK